MKYASALIISLVGTFALLWEIPAEAASHREAPLIAMDPAADNPAVYAFAT